MALTQDQMVKARHHMGYPNVGAVQTFAFGVPAAMQTTFMIEGAMVRILPQAESRLQYLLEKLDKAECKIDDVLDSADMSEAEDVKFRDNGLAKVAQVYKVYQQGLANLMGIVPNPYDQREWLQGGGINVSVIG